MPITIHPRDLSRDLHLSLTAPVGPQQLTPVPERLWDDDQRRFVPTGKNLKDSQGHDLFEPPLIISDLSGRRIDTFRVYIRTLETTLPAMTYLALSADVVLELKSYGKAGGTFIADTLELAPRSTAASLGGASDED